MQTKSTTILVLAMLAMSCTSSMTKRKLRTDTMMDVIPLKFRRTAQSIAPTPTQETWRTVYTTVSTYIHCTSKISDLAPAATVTISNDPNQLPGGFITTTVQPRAESSTSITIKTSTPPMSSSQQANTAQPPSSLEQATTPIQSPSPSPTPIIPTTPSDPASPTSAPPTAPSQPASPAAPALSLPSASDTSTLHTGDLTYYDPGLGACGITSAPTDPIVAISHDLFDAYMPVGASNPNLNPLCGREIEIFRNPAGGVAAGVADGNPDGGVKTMIVKVVDRCTGCAPTDLDVPKMVHEFFVADSTFEGRVEDMQWRWV